MPACVKSDISLADIEKINKHDKIDGAYVLTNERYKTSMIYGAKIILLDEIHLQQIKAYIDVFRQCVTKDDDKPSYLRYLFTSSRFVTEKPLGQQMNNSAIANAMAASFRKAKVLKLTLKENIMGEPNYVKRNMIKASVMFSALAALIEIKFDTTFRSVGKILVGQIK